MIKKYGQFINIFLILILSLVIINTTNTLLEKKKITDLYTGESTIVFSQTGLSADQFIAIANELNEINGVTVSESYIEQNGEQQTSLFIDSIYYNKYLSKLNIEGAGFTDDDFKIIFDEQTVVPILISSEYAEKNSITVNDQITIENFVPNICEMYSDEINFVSSQGTTIVDNQVNNKDMCVADTRYDYLDNDNGFAAIPAQVKGIFDSNGSSFPGFPTEYFLPIDVLVPNFVVDNNNFDLYNLNQYEMQGLTVTKSLVQVFVDYELISDTEFNQNVQRIEEENDVTLYLERANDWQKFAIENNIQMYNQKLINYIFLSLIIIVFWTIQMYYRQMYFKYDYAVLKLLGSQKKQIIMWQIKKERLITLIVIGVLIIIGIITNSLLLDITLYLILFIIELLILYINILITDDSNINSILTGGSL